MYNKLQYSLDSVGNQRRTYFCLKRSFFYLFIFCSGSSLQNGVGKYIERKSEIVTRINNQEKKLELGFSKTTEVALIYFHRKIQLFKYSPLSKFLPICMTNMNPFLKIKGPHTFHGKKVFLNIKNKKAKKKKKSTATVLVNIPFSLECTRCHS